MAKSALDKDLGKVVQMETAAHNLTRSLAAPGLALIFLLAALIWASFAIPDGPLSAMAIAASVIAGYMALNVGANDVANNMGPAVGSRALTMGGALVVAVIFEASGALLAGGDVVTTISRDIIQPSVHMDATTFVTAMMAASLASAVWINIATMLGAPVSTTHAVVGGVVGAGVAAAGFQAIAWPTIGMITASWVISPMLGALFASILLAFTHYAITERVDRLSAARLWVPLLMALLGGVFAMYLASKGLRKVMDIDLTTQLVIGVVTAAVFWVVTVPWVRKRSIGMENRVKPISTLFRIPLIFAAALLSFAHGANDVSNAVGPMAAIVEVAQTGVIGSASVPVPFWVLGIGALGIVVGLALFGPGLIRTVGEKITKMNEIRAFCVALSAGITVLAASALGLPVSSTHIAIGAVFGVGFLREHFTNRLVNETRLSPSARFIDVESLNATPQEAVANYSDRQKRRLVRRQHVLGIAAAWVITVPACGVISALVYLVINALWGG